MRNLGVISQIEKYLNDSIPFSQKRKENPKFLEYQEEKLNSEFFKTSWQIVFYKLPPLPLNDEIKNAINFYFMQLLPDSTTQHGTIKGYCGWLGSLLDMDFLLSQFLWKTEIKNIDPIFKIIEEYYTFLKNECERRGFEIPEPFDIDPLTRFQDNKDKKTVRPPCPECESTKIVSVGVNWLCKDCGRQYRKNRRQP